MYVISSHTATVLGLLLEMTGRLTSTLQRIVLFNPYPNLEFGAIIISLLQIKLRMVHIY